jgi:hypothetical protein
MEPFEPWKKEEKLLKIHRDELQEIYDDIHNKNDNSTKDDEEEKDTKLIETKEKKGSIMFRFKKDA